ncbi:MAG: hypothetical protein ACYCR8_07925, partial [Cuniculiplasma sp.]
TTLFRSYHANSGSITVNGNNISKSIIFSRNKYAVTFMESGLPSGTTWSVTLNGTTQTSATSTIPFSETNGTYSYTIATTNKTYESSPGFLTVNGTSVSRQVSFSKVQYTVTFTETGLSNGTHWSMTFNGLTSSSNGTTITFITVNGTYSYTVSNVSGYSITNGSGTLSVNGSNVAKIIKFTSSPSGLSIMEIIGISGAILAIVAAVGVVMFIRKK